MLPLDMRAVRARGTAEEGVTLICHLVRGRGSMPIRRCAAPSHILGLYPPVPGTLVVLRAPRRVPLPRLRSHRRHDQGHPRIVETGRELAARRPANGNGEEGGFARCGAAVAGSGVGYGVGVRPIDHPMEFVGVEAAEGVEVVFDAIFHDADGDANEVVGNSPKDAGQGGGEAGGGGFDGDVAIPCVKSQVASRWFRFHSALRDRAERVGAVDY